MDTDEAASPGGDAAPMVGQPRRRRRIVAGLASAAAVAVVIAAIPLVREGLHATSSKPKPPTPVKPTHINPTHINPTYFGPTSLTCTEHVLTMPGGHRALGQVWAGDPTGRYLAGEVGDTPGEFAIWDHGVPTLHIVTGSDLPLPPQAPKIALPADIAPDGTVVGYGEWNYQSWVYSRGRFTQLAPPANLHAKAVAISDGGTIVGNAGNLAATSTEPVIWRSATATPVRLPLPTQGSANATVYDIDADGTAVGDVITGYQSQVIVWRPDGSYRLLPPPPGIPDSRMRAISIRHGVILVLVAAGDPKDAVGFGYLYDLATGRYTELPRPDPELRVDAGNSRGWMAGEPLDAWGGAVNTPNTGRITLPTPRKDPNLTTTQSVYSISDDGSVIGGGDVIDANGIAPVFWSCR